jgi:dipeptidyl aminopeptidase/acylaminoacyl peptidase
MGVTGGSYGGYMTNWLIARTDRFKAAVTQRCVSNMISMIGSSDLGMRFLALFGGTTFPWDNLEHYWKLSPISEMNKATTPTLVLHSENDMRCEIEQGEQVFMALKYVGTPTELVRIPAESHGLSRGGRTDRRLSRLRHILRWFNIYLA